MSGGECRAKPTIRLFSAVNVTNGGGLNDIWRHFATLSAGFFAFQDVGEEIGDVVDRPFADKGLVRRDGDGGIRRTALILRREASICV